MSRALFAALILIGALVSLASCKKPGGAPTTKATAQAQAPAKDPNESLDRFDKGEFRAEVSITSEPSFNGKETMQVVEMKNGNIRIEMSVERIGKTVDIVRRTDKRAIMLDVDKKEAEVYDLGGPPSFLEGIASTFGRKRAAKHWIKSVYGETWKSTAPDGSETTQIWLDGPGGLPSKFVVEYRAGVTTTMEYKYVKVGGIPDSDFEIPKGYKVTKKELPKPSSDQ